MLLDEAACYALCWLTFAADPEWSRGGAAARRPLDAEELRRAPIPFEEKVLRGKSRAVQDALAEGKLWPVVRALRQPATLFAGSLYENDRVALAAFEPLIDSNMTAVQLRLHLERSICKANTPVGQALRVPRADGGTVPRHEHLHSVWWALVCDAQVRSQMRLLLDQDEAAATAGALAERDALAGRRARAEKRAPAPLEPGVVRERVEQGLDATPTASSRAAASTTRCCGARSKRRPSTRC